MDPTAANEELPEEVVPVDVRRLPHAFGVTTNHSQFQLPPPEPVPIPDDLPAYLASLKEWERLLFDNLQINVPQAQLFETLTTQQFTVCSDGSQLRHRASFAWVLADNDGARLVECSGPAFGGDPNSY